jgi:hypothetical protein
MLDEIHALFDQLRKPPAWRDNLEVLDPQTIARTRAEFEKYWRLAMISLDELETKLIEIYEAGVDDPAALQVFDEVNGDRSVHQRAARGARS